jgi:hypothetical protein
MFLVEALPVDLAKSKAVMVAAVSVSWVLDVQAVEAETSYLS